MALLGTLSIAALLLMVLALLGLVATHSLFSLSPLALAAQLAAVAVRSLGRGLAGRRTFSVASTTVTRPSCTVTCTVPCIAETRVTKRTESEITSNGPCGGALPNCMLASAPPGDTRERSATRKLQPGGSSMPLSVAAAMQVLEPANAATVGPVSATLATEVPAIAATLR